MSDSIAQPYLMSNKFTSRFRNHHRRQKIDSINFIFTQEIPQICPGHCGACVSLGRHSHRNLLEAFEIAHVSWLHVAKRFTPFDGPIDSRKVLRPGMKSCLKSGTRNALLVVSQFCARNLQSVRRHVRASACSARRMVAAAKDYGLMRTECRSFTFQHACYFFNDAYFFTAENTQLFRRSELIDTLLEWDTGLFSYNLARRSCSCCIGWYVTIIGVFKVLAYSHE